MKRYIALILIFIAFVSTILLTQKKETQPVRYAALSEKISSSSEWLNTKRAIEGLEDNLRKNPSNNGVKLKLGQAYTQQGRETGDHNYYDALAYKMINEVLEADAANFEALCIKAALQASAHQFSEALATSQAAIKINPYNSYIYGIECDAYVELGKYEAAINSADKMTSLRPDIRSYSRISYLREIIGDYPGAMDAMERAVSSGTPGFEQTEWARTYLGRLYEITGKPKEAEELYAQAVSNRSNYAPALAGLGRIAKLNNDYKTAILHYTNAVNVMQDYSFHHELALLYRLTNDKKKSFEEFQTALDMLIKHRHPTSEENGIGHNIDRELALVYTSMHQYDKALNNANAEYERRPDNIDVSEVMAWAQFNAGNYQAAQSYIFKALRTKSKNAELWYKAGLIFKANKYEELGNKYLTIALRTNPYLDTDAFNNTDKNLAVK